MDTKVILKGNSYNPLTCVYIWAQPLESSTVLTDRELIRKLKEFNYKVT